MVCEAQSSCCIDLDCGAKLSVALSPGEQLRGAKLKRDRELYCIPISVFIQVSSACSHFMVTIQPLNQGLRLLLVQIVSRSQF